MVGKFHVEITSKRLRYSLDIQRKVTIIRGDSGTGKTTLARMIVRSRRDESPYTVTCEKECLAFTVDNFSKETDLSRYEDSIIFIDEDVTFMRTKEFAEIVKNSDCYFVLITREKLEMLPYSCKSVYELKGNTLVSEEVSIENDMHSLFSFVSKPKISLKGILSCIIVEDKNAGYEFFKSIADNKGIDCISAEENSNVIEAYMERIMQKNDTGILIIVDSAAFGPYYEALRNIVKKFYNSVIFLPESFEYIILSSKLFKTPSIASKLENTYDYAESKRYFSWERYYTSLLVETSKGTELKYSKSKLNSNYLIPENKRMIQKMFIEETGLN